MRKFLLLFSLAVFCGEFSADAQSLRKRAVARNVPMTAGDVLSRRSAKAVQRVQPAASVTYSVIDGVRSELPSSWEEIDAQGQTVASYSSPVWLDGAVISQYVQQTTYDYSRGYPVMLDHYSYTEFPQEQETTALTYTQRTAMTDGVRTALEVEYFDDVELDAAGHITHTLEQTREFKLDTYYTWNGDALTSYREVEEDYDYAGDGSVIYRMNMSISDIEEVYAAEPFNAYDIDVLEPLWNGTWLCNATGTLTEDGETVDFVLTGTVSDDRKVLTQTMKGGDILDDVIVRTYTDDNGSYTLVDTDRSYGDFYLLSETVTFNEMGDMTERITEEKDASGTEYYYKEKFEWEYDAQGRPVSMSSYSASTPESEYVQNAVTEFTRWHESASVSGTVADGEVLGADVYTTDGVKVCELAAGEVADVRDRLSGKGIYVVVKKTSRGPVVEKIAVR